MIIFVALTPSTPLLLPSIHKDKGVKLQKTLDAMEELEENLYASSPDVILLLSEHPTSFEDAFSINVSDPYTFDVSAFGDLGLDIKLHPDIETIDHLQRYLRNQSIPVTLSTDEALDHGSAATVSILTKHLPNVKLIPITYSSLDSKAHFQFGQALKDIVINSNKRIAIIASGDLSHALESTSPAGYNKHGKEFDEKITELITQKNTAGLITLDETLVKEAQQTVYQQLLILFGLLENISVKPKILSYESPFGVGYMVVDFEIR
ncbi:AmmeMemoRadiSam system protein B [Patescibacteria group bacterium]|nr:AmmeMemoRadiSam system protein B [Patescibacteria group bacterium]MBU4453000.1 AmmeMemoRadiSam system protein B [Patescibacteria group bacterium]MCG2687205.1 AmmeMemoRadiSam system protein B [Candidatus Parcubacteria bacterium]